MPVATSHSTQLYTVGRGILYIAEWNGDTAPSAGDFNDMGNAISIDVELTEDVMEHYTTRSGLKKKDKVVIIQSGYTVSFVLDEESIRNLRMWLKGTMSGSNVIMANTALNAEYALKFVSANATGPNQTWEFWKAKVSPNGTFSLISDDWAQLSFTAEGLADEAGHPTSQYFNVTFATTTTTTTAP